MTEKKHFDILEPLSHQASNIFFVKSCPQTSIPLFCTSSNSPTVTRNVRSRKDKGNIRHIHVNEWLVAKRKTVRNSG